MKISESKLKKTAVITAICCLLMTASCGKTNEITKKKLPDNSSVQETSAAVDTAALSDSSALALTSAPTDPSNPAEVTSTEAKSAETLPAADPAQPVNAGGAAVQTETAATAPANDPMTKLPDNTPASQSVTSKIEETTSAAATETDSTEADAPADPDREPILTKDSYKVNDLIPRYKLSEGYDSSDLHDLSAEYLTESHQMTWYGGYYMMKTKMYDALSKDAAEITTIKAFSTVTAYACVAASNSGGYWTYIEYNGRFGWIDNCYFLTGNSYTNVPNSDKIYVADNIYTAVPACNYTEYYLLADSLGLYSSPSEASEQLLTLSEGTGVYFLGDNDPYSDWRFIVIETMPQITTYGWVKIDDFYTLEDYSPLYFQKYGVEFTPQRFSRGGGKPVLYLYPEKPTDVSVKLKLSGCEFYSTYPKYNNGWEVTAYPGGRLVSKADGCGYDYLFWDTRDKNSYTFPDGFCVKGEDTEKFLRKTLKQIGLNEREMNEFIVYWLPQMEHEPYNVIRFQSSEYEKTTKLTISPKPDSLLRVFMTYYSVDKPQYMIPQEIKPFERKGFTAVEWGGEKLVGLW